MIRTLKASLFGLVMLSASAPAVGQDAPDLSLDMLPDIAREMLDEAAKKGDAAAVNAVADATTAVLPSFAEGIAQYQAWTLQQLAVNADNTEAVESTVADASDAVDAKDGEAASDTVVAATDEVAPEVRTGFFALEPWTGNVGLSAINSTGNSVNTSVGFALNAKREVGKFTHNVAGYFDIARAGNPAIDPDVVDDSVLTQKRWGASYQLDYAISDRLNAFGRFSYDEDQFSGFDYRLFSGAGLGYFVAKSDPFTWKVDAGPGYRYSPIDDTDEVQSEFALYAGSDIDWVIREGLTFTSDIGVTWTSPSTTIEATHGINAALWGGFVTGVSYYFRHETNPPLGRVQNDTVLRATLGYGF